MKKKKRKLLVWNSQGSLNFTSRNERTREHHSDGTLLQQSSSIISDLLASSIPINKSINQTEGRPKHRKLSPKKLAKGEKTWSEVKKLAIIRIRWKYSSLSYVPHKEILTPWFMEPRCSMPHSKALSNNRYYEPNQPNSSYWYLFL